MIVQNTDKAPTRQKQGPDKAKNAPTSTDKPQEDCQRIPRQQGFRQARDERHRQGHRQGKTDKAPTRLVPDKPGLSPTRPFFSIEYSTIIAGWPRTEPEPPEPNRHEPNRHEPTRTANRREPNRHEPPNRQNRTDTNRSDFHFFGKRRRHENARTEILCRMVRSRGPQLPQGLFS